MQLTTQYQNYLDCFHSIASAEPQTLREVAENLQDGRREALALQFSTKCLIFIANCDDDTITVRCEDCSSFDTSGWTRLQNNEFWAKLIGHGFGWGWVTINQQGYCDGVLLSFNGLEPTIILNVVGSAITINRVINEREAARRFSRASYSEDRSQPLVGPEQTPGPPFEIPFPSPRRTSLRSRKQAFRNPWSERVSGQPMPPITRKTRSVVKAIAYTLVGAICSTLVGALSYGIGYLISLGVGQGWLALRLVVLINPIVALSEWIGWGWIGAAVGAAVGLSVGDLRRRRIGLAFLGAILGALVFMIDNPRTTNLIDGLINWTIIAGIGGLIACGIARVAHGLKKYDADADESP